MSKKTEMLKSEKNKKKRIIGYIISGVFVIFIAWIIILNTSSEEYNYFVKNQNGTKVYNVEDVSLVESDSETDLVLITVNDYGAMVAELYPDIAPITVKNFKKLISNKFYDGLTFHRVIKDFMIQTGDPTATGSGGSEENIKGEFNINGVNNTLSHTRGVLSMARRGPAYGEEETSDTMNSASSQFFIVHKDSTYLDGKYASFGKVLYGFDVLDKIASVNTDNNDKPLTDVKIDEVRFVKYFEGED